MERRVFGQRLVKSAPCSPAKPMAKKPSMPARADSFHVIHKVPVGDTAYVKAKHVQLVDKDPERAIPLFWAAINAGDRVDSALKDMAIVMKQQNRPEEAIEAIKSLRHKCSEQAQESLDNVLLDLYKRCNRLDDQIALLKHKLNMINQGRAFNGKTTKTARSQGKKFQVSIEQEATRLLGNLGWAYMQQSNYVAAEAVYRKALSIGPDNNKICNLGICLMHQGRIGEAKVLLQTVKPAHADGADSHLKSYERAQEMLRQIEGNLDFTSSAFLMMECIAQEEDAYENENRNTNVIRDALPPLASVSSYFPPPGFPPKPNCEHQAFKKILKENTTVNVLGAQSSFASKPEQQSSLNIAAAPFFSRYKNQARSSSSLSNIAGMAKGAEEGGSNRRFFDENNNSGSCFEENMPLGIVNNNSRDSNIPLQENRAFQVSQRKVLGSLPIARHDESVQVLGAQNTVKSTARRLPFESMGSNTKTFESKGLNTKPSMPFESMSLNTKIFESKGLNTRPSMPFESMGLNNKPNFPPLPVKINTSKKPQEYATKKEEIANSPARGKDDGLPDMDELEEAMFSFCNVKKSHSSRLPIFKEFSLLSSPTA